MNNLLVLTNIAIQSSDVKTFCRMKRAIKSFNEHMKQNLGVHFEVMAVLDFNGILHNDELRKFIPKKRAFIDSLLYCIKKNEEYYPFEYYETMLPKNINSCHYQTSLPYRSSAIDIAWQCCGISIYSPGIKVTFYTSDAMVSFRFYDKKLCFTKSGNYFVIFEQNLDEKILASERDVVFECLDKLKEYLCLVHACRKQHDEYVLPFVKYVRRDFIAAEDENPFFKTIINGLSFN